jgi:hypothetical protein
MDHHSLKPDARIPLTITLVIIFLLDMAIVGGLLYKGHANFAALIKNLHHG